MTCKTCRREDMADTCGPQEGWTGCPCCGLVIIAEADGAEQVVSTTVESQTPAVKDQPHAVENNTTEENPDT